MSGGYPDGCTGVPDEWDADELCDAHDCRNEFDKSCGLCGAYFCADCFGEGDYCRWCLEDD